MKQPGQFLSLTYAHLQRHASRTHLHIKLTKVVFQIFRHTTKHKFRTRTHFFINIATHRFKITKSPTDKAIEMSALPIYQ
jgi:hypothetical protein